MREIGTSRLRGVVLLLLCLAMLPSGGRTIQWFCDSGGLKQFSDGAALDTTMRFELGVFADGFVPTTDNRSEWSAHWVAAQRVSYYPPTAVFSGTVTVTGNDVPFVAGTRAYIWGFNEDLELGEWILASDSSWTWPTPEPFKPFDLEWNIGAATEVLAGAVNASGNPFLLQAEAIPAGVPPTTSWPQWQMDELAGESADGPDDDPDGDGLSNLEEYAIGTPPLAVSPRIPVRPGFVTIGVDRYLTMAIPLRADRAVDLAVWVSEDLVNWSHDPAATVIVSEAPSTVTYRSVEAIDGVLRQFLWGRLDLAE